RDAGRARAVRRRRHRRGRRVRADRRQARRDTAAPRPRPGQRPGEPAQRAPRAHADRQRRRRPRDLPQAVRRATGIGHRGRRGRGAGLPAIERLGYLAEQVAYQLDGIKHVVVAGTKAPVSFFAYPGKASDLVPEGSQVHTLASVGQDVTRALDEVADLIAADTEPVLAAASRPALPSGPLTPQNWVDVVGALLPENAIIADEANTSGLMLPMAT